VTGPGRENPAEGNPIGADDAEVDLIVSRGPSGAFAVAGIATALVLAMYLAFYLFVYLPRGAVQ